MTIKNPIDAHVGSRLRARRMLIGMSQERLADMLGLTFQQVQKYEKGANRISAGKLYTLSKILDVPVQFFFDDMPLEIDATGEAIPKEAADSFNNILSFGRSREGIELIKNYSSISNRTLKRSILNLIKSAGEQENG